MIDIQSETKQSRFAIERCGVTGIKMPIRVRCEVSGEIQTTTGSFDLAASLPASERGTHMSRFIEVLTAATMEERAFDIGSLAQLAAEIRTRLHADDAEIKVTMPWFREVKAPVSGKVSLAESDLTFRVVDRLSGVQTKELGLTVAAKALCPCSKAISDRGAHNQRSFITARITVGPDGAPPAISRLIELLETSASSPLYPLLKREDEKYITESAYDNPAFVEDIVRNAAERLYDLPQVAAFTVEALNQESIHRHDCFAKIVFARD